MREGVSESALYMIGGIVSLTVNVGVVSFMIYKIVKTKRNPYKNELYVDMKAYKSIKSLAATTK